MLLLTRFQQTTHNLPVLSCCLMLQDKEFYHYMKTYSPVDNIKTADYPNILVTAGLHDPRVGYW